MADEQDHLQKVVLPEDVQKPEQLSEKIHSLEGRVADVITEFSGSMAFVYLHAVWFAFWILANAGALRPLVHPFDPFPYGLLTMVVSLEAIFLSTFILISQNRQALVDTYREIEEEQEQLQEDKEQDELEQDVEQLEKGVGELGVEFDDMQQDLDDIKKALDLIQQKLTHVEKNRSSAASKVK
jgi:uncharacterized membrane protein